VSLIWYIILVLMVLVPSGSPPLVAEDNSSLLGEKAPKFYAKQLNGKDFFLSRRVGDQARPQMRSPLVISFFTTSCIPCRQEIPCLMELEQQYPQVGFYLVNIGEKEEQINKYIRKMGYRLPVLLDKYGMIAKKYQAQVTPTLVIISANQEILHYEHGFNQAKAMALRQKMASLFAVPDSTELESEGQE